MANPQLRIAMKNPLSIVCALAAGAILCGCSKQETPARKVSAKTTDAVAGQSAAPAWNWDAYPAVRRMRLGLLPCSLQPRSQITIHSPLPGALKVYIDVPQTNLVAGFVWGEFEPTMFANEAKAIEEARVKLDEREKLLMELELPRQRLKAERDFEEMQRKVAMIRLLSTNKELADLTLSVGESGNALRPDSLDKAEAELALLGQSLTYLRETNMAALGVDLPGMRTEWENRKFEFERRQAQARIKMPFTGQLTLTLPMAEGVVEYPVTQGQELGVARDLSVVRLRVPMSYAAWSSLPSEKLSAMVGLGNGKRLEASFAYQKIERVQNREESVYYFQFAAEDAGTVARLIGTDITCELWFNLDQTTRIVPKLALLMHNPAHFQGGNWGAGIKSAFPGARLAVEGQTDLGLVIPSDLKHASAR